MEKKTGGTPLTNSDAWTMIKLQQLEKDLAALLADYEE
jgi:hypothetical protein